jgi:hypothetical protein
LLNFGHSKVEVATLEDVKLIDIEFKTHDPYQIVEKHLAQCNMKIYMHEYSPYDNIFRGIRSYEEVQGRVQALSPNQQAIFFTFQKPRWSSFPKILQGELITTPPEQGSIPPSFEIESSGKQTTEEIPNNIEVSTQELEASSVGYLGQQTKVQSETILKQKQMVIPLSPVTPTDTSQTVEGNQFTEIGSPITALTPL